MIQFMIGLQEAKKELLRIKKVVESIEHLQEEIGLEISYNIPYPNYEELLELINEVIFIDYRLEDCKVLEYNYENESYNEAQYYTNNLQEVLKKHKNIAIKEVRY